MADDAIRVYLTELRQRRNISQQKMADEVGVSRLTWNYYETKKTKDGLKGSVLLAALRYLRGSFDHLRDLAAVNATEELGRRLAELRVVEDETLEYLMQTYSAEEVDRILAEEEARAERRLEEIRTHRRLPPPEA